ncbi:MAG: hypothetical protein SFY69_01975 [Planctomycetota bacterium]|nr:hypothetical protein [Planctomycetota bacterium]
MPRCPTCDYDLSGLLNEQTGIAVCPECNAAWSDTLEKGLVAWPGWGALLLRATIIPGAFWALTLILHGIGSASGPSMWRTAAWALTFTPFLAGCVASIFLARHYVQAPRVRRPHGGLIFGVCIGVVVSLEAMGLLLVRLIAI